MGDGVSEGAPAGAPETTEEPTLTQLRQRLAVGVPPGCGSEDGVRRQWWAALATLQEELLEIHAQRPEHLSGLWLAAPLPALYEPLLLAQLDGWIWAPAELSTLVPAPAPLLPGARPNRSDAGQRPPERFRRLPLEPDDGTDPLLVVITPELQVALAVAGGPEARQLLVRFEPQVLTDVLTLLDRRLQRQGAGEARILRRALHSLGPLRSDSERGLRFWPRLAERLATMAPSLTLQPLSERRGNRAVSQELALLEALTHEVRTPLATIRTLIRSLLRRRDLPEVVRQRLEQIDGECSEQIDRFGLIFLAAELQRQPAAETPAGATALARTDLSALLEQMRELWTRQLSRRGLVLELVIAPELPPVLSDPGRLETTLGGLIDRFSRSLASGSTVRVSLQPAGARLKLHLSSHGASSGVDQNPAGHHRALVGPVLSWNPTTGSLQLSRQATQQLFARLGGRLAERGDNGLTVFFPVC